MKKTREKIPRQIPPRRHNIPLAPAPCTHKNAQARTPLLKGSLRIRRHCKQELRARQEAENTQFLASFRRGLLGFAGLAPHSGRSSIPFQKCSGTEDSSLPTKSAAPTVLPALHGCPMTGQNSPDKQQSIRNNTCSVKSSSDISRGNLCGNHRAANKKKTSLNLVVLPEYTTSFLIFALPPAPAFDL